MELENHSSNRFTISKKEKQNNLSIRINNEGSHDKVFNIKAWDEETKKSLSLSLDEMEIKDQIQIAPHSISMLEINITEVEGKVSLEVSQKGSGSGMSIRQKSSTSKDGSTQNLIELIIR